VILGFGEFSTIAVESIGPLWVLRIHRPEALNALNSIVLNELGVAIRLVSEMDTEHAQGLIITGAGDKAFVAGADIKELAKLNRTEAEKFARRGQAVFHELSLLKLPVIAAVNGFALGGGCELALACDFIYASENAKFGLPEVSLGVIPGFGGTVRLSRAVGIRKARELIFSGEIISAAEALQMGLVNRVFPQGELLKAALDKMTLIASRAPRAVDLAKKSILNAWDLGIEEAQHMEAENFSELFDLADTREGLSAFLEKRKPVFRGI
jgi:enoyl-CoA hydratase